MSSSKATEDGAVELRRHRLFARASAAGSPPGSSADPSDSGSGVRNKSSVSAEEQAALGLADALQELEVERAAHEETAAHMVMLQQRLEVTIQELANLERYVRASREPPGSSAAQRLSDDEKAANAERLRKEESYLKSRLDFVQGELRAVLGEEPQEPDNPDLAI